MKKGERRIYNNEKDNDAKDVRSFADDRVDDRNIKKKKQKANDASTVTRMTITQRTTETLQMMQTMIAG